jgi:hypothetical protein
MIVFHNAASSCEGAGSDHGALFVWFYPRTLPSTLHSGPVASARVFGFELSPLTNTALGCLIIYMLLWNISTVPGSGLTLSDRVRSVRYVLRLNQKWSMFALVLPKVTGGT